MKCWGMPYGGFIGIAVIRGLPRLVGNLKFVVRVRGDSKCGLGNRLAYVLVDVGGETITYVKTI